MALDDAQLPCGAELEALVAQVADGEPPAAPDHQARCPYCRAALRAIEPAWADVRALAARPVPVPPGLAARVMAQVRAVAVRLVDTLVLTVPRGETRISHGVVGQVARRAALAVPGVVFASAQPVAHEPPAPARLDVALRLVIAFGPAVEALAGAVRAAVREQVTRLTGAELDAVDVRIEDLGDVSPP